MRCIERARGSLKSMLSNRGLGIHAKKCLYEEVIVPTALYRAETWGMRSAERRTVNVLEMSRSRFQEQVQCLFVGLVALSFFDFNYFPFLFFSSICW